MPKVNILVMNFKCKYFVESDETQKKRNVAKWLLVTPLREPIYADMLKPLEDAKRMEGKKPSEIKIPSL